MGDVLDVAIIAGSIDFGQLADRHTADQTGADCAKGAQIAKDRLAEYTGGDDGDCTCNICSDIQCVLRIGSFAFAADQDAEDRGHQADTADREGKQHAFAGFVNQRAKCESTDDRSDIGLKQVRTHTGYVTDIVTDIVSDNRRIARVVFRNSGFDFTDQVGSDVSRFGVDTAAYASEQGDRTGAKAKACDMFDVLAKGQEEYTQTKHAQTGNAHAHDRAAGKSDAQRLRHPVLRGCRCAYISFGGNLHAEETG